MIIIRKIIMMTESCFANNNNWACAVKHVTFYKGDDTLMGGAKFISLPQSCSL